MLKQINSLLEETISTQFFILSIFQIVCLFFSTHSSVLFVLFQVCTIFLVLVYGFQIFYAVWVYENVETRSMREIFLTWISLYVWVSFFVIIYSTQDYWIGSTALIMMGVLDFKFDFSKLLKLSRVRLDERIKEMESALELLRKRCP